ncbi:MAG: nicotinate (nicotinamide) nucleotide adenylyltransferase [Ignavibacteriae bacterium]|nr:nicotinate (nicotinamide) nucleotide adenylyltransferase [Ignavibacteriota bacterium]
MIKIGIFGGTFNPPHLAHSVLSQKVKEILGLDKLIFIPSFLPPLKREEEVLEIRHRFVMAKIAFERNPGCEVSDIEINCSTEKSYTVDTLSVLHEIFKGPDVKFFLIIGIDNLIDFPKWKSPEKLFTLADVVVINRPGCTFKNVKKEYAEKALFVELPLMDISSTMIRDYVKNGKPISHLVLPEIESYINNNKLYK